MQICFWRPEANLGCSSSGAIYTLFFETMYACVWMCVCVCIDICMLYIESESLSGTWDHHCLSCLAHKLQVSFSFHLPSAGIISRCYHSWLVSWVLGLYARATSTWPTATSPLTLVSLFVLVATEILFVFVCVCGGGLLFVFHSLVDNPKGFLCVFNSYSWYKSILGPVTGINR